MADRVEGRLPASYGSEVTSLRTPGVALTLLVSCCNRDGALWLVSINAGKFEPRVEAVLPSPCTGIARGQQGIYVGHPDGVWAFGPDMRRAPEADLELPGSDVHDVKVSPAGNLLVAETGCDRLASYTGEGTAVSVWKPTAEGGDRCHLNSTTFLDGALLVAMFDAEGRGEPWGERLDGVIAEADPLRPGEFNPLWRGVEHPHSLVAVDGELWWCDSRRRRVMRNGTEVVRLPGYTRGLAVTEAWVVVGQSRSDNHSVKVEGFGSCGVWCYPREDGGLGVPLVVELPSTEVYDVLPIPVEEASNLQADLLAQKGAALAEKDAALGERDALLADKDAALADKDAALADKDAALAEKGAALAEKGAALAESSRRISDLESRLSTTEKELRQAWRAFESVTNTLGYRSAERLRAVLRWLFPPGSWRRRPYRAIRRLTGGGADSDLNQVQAPEPEEESDHGPS